MQGAALAEIGLEDWSYEAIDVPPDALAERVRAMPRDGFVGANVTVPHKVAALRLADRASDTAREVGAANTLSFENGGIAAENTDAAGFLATLPRSPAGMRALVLGAGGSARAVVWSLITRDAEVAIWNRTVKKGEQLAADFDATSLPTPRQRLATTDFDLIVNCTTVGMASADARLEDLPIDIDAIAESQIVVDLAYGTGDTDLVQAARARGATVIDGLEVLVRQGAASLRIWTGKEPPLEVMRRAARTTS